MSKAKRPKNRITSIQYVHDPEAAQKWMELFMEITKKQFINDCLHKNSDKNNEN